MLKLSKKVEYGIIALMDLAGTKDTYPVTSKSVAEHYRIPHELLGKVMQSLAKSGLLISIQGVKGGYILGKSPEKISLKQVIEILEGPISIISCGHQAVDDCNCIQLPNCSIKSPMEIIQNELDVYFSKISLKDLKSKYYGHLSEPVQLTV